MIKKVNKSEIKSIANLAVLLWPNHSVEELEEEFLEISLKEDAQVFIIYESNLPVGFAQCQLRYDYVEGTKTSPVGYLEGIFVKEKFRHKGYAKQLLQACENWAKMNECKEFASDCEIENEDSFQFHKAMGFSEANRIICFTKRL